MLTRNFWKIKAVVILVLVSLILGWDRYQTHINQEAHKVNAYVLANKCVVIEKVDGSKVYDCGTGYWSEQEVRRRALSASSDRK